METIYTIGHSNHPIGRFLDLLKLHAIEIVADTRSKPFSRYSPQFNRNALTKSLADTGVSYLYLGGELGGRPENPDYYDSDGRVRYERVAASSAFQEAIAQLRSGARARRVAVLCAEEDPAHCHRRFLIGKALMQQGVELLHIRRDGSVERESLNQDSTQLPLFRE